MAFVVLFRFIANEKSFIKSGDGLQQHYVSLVYYARWVREIIRNVFLNHRFEIPLWDFDIGYGSDILTTFQYYCIGDPFALFSFLVPAKYMEYYYCFMVILRMYLSGMSFRYYCLRMKNKGTAVLVGSIAYVFCGYMLCAVFKHPFFVNPMVYVPLLLAGVEKIFAKEKPTLFIGMVFLSAASNFYFFYMIVLGVIFYAVIRFFTFRHEKLLKEMLVCAGKFLGYGMIGVCMAGPLLFPVILYFLDSSRIDADTSYHMFYQISYYKNFLRYFMTNDSPGFWSFLGFPAAAFLCIIFLFAKRRHHNAWKAAFVIMTGMMCLPFFGTAMNGFSYVCNRWCFWYAALICYIMVIEWQELWEGRRSLLASAAIAGLGYIVIVLLLCKETGLSSAGNTILSCVFLAVSILLMGCAILLRKKKYRMKLIPAFFFILTIVQIATNGLIKRDTAKYIDFGSAWKNVKLSAPEAAKRAMAEEDRFCRFETDDFLVKNTAALAGVPGLQYYWSLENPAIPDYLIEMALSDVIVFSYKNLDRRTFLDTLSGVKYGVYEDGSILPFGFEEVGETVLNKNKKYKIYKNSYAMPFGYTYDSYITQQAYEKMTAAKRQEALLQGIVLKEQDEKYFEKFRAIEPVYEQKSMDYTIICGKGVKQKGDTEFVVKKNGASVTFTFDGAEKCETYLLFRGADFSMRKQKGSRLSVMAGTEEAKNKFLYLPPAHRYCAGQKDFLVNLGYHESPQKSIKVTFPKKGSYKFESIEVICQPMGQYVKRAAALKEEAFDEEIGTNCVRGTINCSGDKILCLQIPYSSGWSATVDGEKAPLFKANGMYMALTLCGGDHTIELHYKTPGLSAGIAAGLAGFLVFFYLIAAQITFFRNRRSGY